MKRRITEHIIGIFLVSFAMIGVFFVLDWYTATSEIKRTEKVGVLRSLPVSNINDPLERKLTADCIHLFYPGQRDANEALIDEFYRFKERQLTISMKSSSRMKKLSIREVITLGIMDLKFLVIYVIVLALTYYWVQTLGSLRFVLHQQKRHLAINGRPGDKPSFSLRRLLFQTATTTVYFILFSPAYVIAYSIRTEFSTDSIFFMIILGIISNGLLITYTNKFYAFLVTESRKGYVENAMVKNLRSNYSISSDGISLKSLFSIRKKFEGHLFDHIFQNAQYQYLSTIKEQASFLITGLIIIEMALNIHGHLCYELLRQLLYKNHAFVLAIMFFIFLTVKVTEIFADFMFFRETERYENR